ncbi:MAG: hypothetical protein IK111_01150 [Lachnospiraceae bacterium]|nr:hypothetical protein [Lachnospiraceae bacterium]
MKKLWFLLLVPLIVAIGGAAVYVAVNATESDALELSDYFELSYDGYNGSGSVSVERNDDMLLNDVKVIMASRHEAVFKDKKVTDDDFLRFAAGIEALPDKEGGLKNGDEIILSYLYDEELSRRLKININASEAVYTVKGLSNAAPLSVDDLFKDLEVTFEGTSPDITMTINNNSDNPLISTLVFAPETEQERYALGDVVRVRCYFDEKTGRNDRYYVDAASGECVREYTVSGCGRYVTDVSEIPANAISQAVSEGRKAFVDANEYGVRIFCEAHLVPVYINQQATFRYLSPSIEEIYFKSVNPGEAGKTGNDYNELDLIYNVQITQADGVTCPCHAVVRFSNFKLTTDGILAYDMCEPTIMSASYNHSSIIKNVITKYEDSYSIEKLDPGKYR